MKERFEGALNRARLIETLKRQEFICQDADLARLAADVGELIEFKHGDIIIRQDDEGDDVFLLLTGAAEVKVNGAQVQLRKAGEPVGEMAAIEPTQRRSATIIALETVVALRLDSSQFAEIGERFPAIWKPMAQLLSRRLFQRNSDIPVPNELPKAFIISSSEALPIAEAVQSQLQPKLFTNIWSQGTFFAGGYFLEALEKAVEESDFAIAIAQDDDVIDSRGKSAPTLRDNVLFELGLFMGKLTRYRTFLMHPKIPNLKLPSDLQGLVLTSYDPDNTVDPAVRVKGACDQILEIAEKLGVRSYTVRSS